MDRYNRYIARYGQDAAVTKKVKDGMRAYLLTSHDVLVFEVYYVAFPDDDFELFTVIEDGLYKQYLGNKNLSTAALYLKYFPKGRYAQSISVEASTLAPAVLDSIFVPIKDTLSKKAEQ